MFSAPVPVFVADPPRSEAPIVNVPTERSEGDCNLTSLLDLPNPDVVMTPSPLVSSHRLDALVVADDAGMVGVDERA